MFLKFLFNNNINEFPHPVRATTHTNTALLTKIYLITMEADFEVQWKACGNIT